MGQNIQRAVDCLSSHVGTSVCIRLRPMLTLALGFFFCAFAISSDWYRGVPAGRFCMCVFSFYIWYIWYILDQGCHTMKKSARLYRVYNIIIISVCHVHFSSDKRSQRVGSLLNNCALSTCDEFRVSSWQILV